MSNKIVQTAGRDMLGDFAAEFAHFNDDVLFVRRPNKSIALTMYGMALIPYAEEGIRRLLEGDYKNYDVVRLMA